MPAVLLHGLFAETQRQRGGGKPALLLRDYVYAILFLYKYLDSKSGGRASSTHPPAFYRAFVFQIFIHDTAKRLPEMMKDEPEPKPNIEQLIAVDVESLTRQAYIRFFAAESGLSEEQFVNRLDDAQTFFNSISPTLKRLGLGTG